MALFEIHLESHSRVDGSYEGEDGYPRLKWKTVREFHVVPDGELDKFAERQIGYASEQDDSYQFDSKTLAKGVKQGELMQLKEAIGKVLEVVE